MKWNEINKLSYVESKSVYEGLKVGARSNLDSKAPRAP